MEPFKEIEKRSLEGGRIVLWSRGQDWVVAYLKPKANSWDMWYPHTFSHYKCAFMFYDRATSLTDFEESF
jgi:hypothetical protein